MIDKEELIEHQKAVSYSDKICTIIGVVPKSNYGIDVSFNDIEYTLNQYKEMYDLQLNPDFQRGHVWTETHQIRFIEALLQGTIGDSGRLITFNCGDFSPNNRSTTTVKDMVCVDGLQRLTAVRRWMNDEFKIFHDIVDGGVSKDFFDRTRLSFKSMTNGLRFQILGLEHKQDVLKYYLAFNSGGVIHSDDEINRVKKMLEDLRNECWLF